MKKKFENQLPTFKIGFIIILCMGTFSCRKFIEVNPPIEQITAESAFSNDVTANAAIIGIYSRLSQNNLIQNVTPYCGLYSDEVEYYFEGAPRSEFFNSQLSLASSSSINSNFWLPAYQLIYPANLAIEKLEQSSRITSTLQTKLTGEAKFIRAYLYLQLSGLFGDVPLVITSDFEQNSTLPKAPKNQVMDQAINDLLTAIPSLGENIEPEKIRANRWAAKSLLARAYLYQGNYALAERYANEVIESNRYALASDLSKTFLKNSSEAILQFFPTQSNQNTPDGVTFLPATTAESPKYVVSQNLLNAFEPGDSRRNNWIGSRQFQARTFLYPAKYKIINSAVLSEYLMVIRLAELYLIRAEARIQNGNILGGIADLNSIRKRSRMSASTQNPNPLPDLNTGMSKPEALLAVERERRIELMFEMGHRWYDLQRTLRAETILKSLKPLTWQSRAVLWPIPDEQLRANPFLTQNNGY
ncbi:RagB/SusD family nutrient uptake outer membrane protein [Pedobacter suwonensis]|uniref:RagB/SusD family nutrient uptake outer membrane protein n=1 Tax=Pedobacter suwonensis TaxID=332999 RepID=UPI0036C1EBB1